MEKSFFINKRGRLPRHHRNQAERIEYLGSDMILCGLTYKILMYVF